MTTRGTRAGLRARAVGVLGAVLAAVVLLGACSVPPEQRTGGSSAGQGAASPTSAPDADSEMGFGGDDGSGDDASDEEDSEDEATNEATPSESGEDLPAEPTATGTADTRLKIVLDPVAKDDPDSAAARTTSTLLCRGEEPLVGSDVPDPFVACVYVTGGRGLITSPAKNQACTQQYGGAATARVTGEVKGKKVDRSFALRNGCEIDAWKAAASLLGDPGDPSVMH